MVDPTNFSPYFVIKSLIRRFYFIIISIFVSFLISFFVFETTFETTYSSSAKYVNNVTLIESNYNTITQTLKNYSFCQIIADTSVNQNIKLYNGSFLSATEIYDGITIQKYSSQTASNYCEISFMCKDKSVVNKILFIILKKGQVEINKLPNLANIKSDPQITDPESIGSPTENKHSFVQYVGPYIAVGSFFGLFLAILTECFNSKIYSPNDLAENNKRIFALRRKKTDQFLSFLKGINNSLTGDVLIPVVVDDTRLIKTNKVAQFVNTIDFGDMNKNVRIELLNDADYNVSSIMENESSVDDSQSDFNNIVFAFIPYSSIDLYSDLIGKCKYVFAGYIRGFTTEKKAKMIKHNIRIFASYESVYYLIIRMFL